MSSEPHIYAVWHPQGNKKISALWKWCEPAGKQSELVEYVKWLNQTLCQGDPRPDKPVIPCEFFLSQPPEEEDDNPFILLPGQSVEPHEAPSLWQDQAASLYTTLARNAIQDDEELSSPSHNDSSNEDDSLEEHPF